MSWTEFKSTFQKIASEDPEGAIEVLKLKCATDKELFAVVFFPHYCTREFNTYHKDLFRNFKFGERRIRRVRGAPRGSAKSTFETLIDPIHDVAYGVERFIAILSSTAPNANKKLKNIRLEVYNNLALRAVYGVRFPNKKAGESEFIVHSEAGSTLFVAFGKEAEVRGVSYGEARPTKVILDDYERSEEVQSERLRQKTKDRYFEDVAKVGDTETNFIFVGTVLHKESLLAELIKNPAYDGQIYKSIVTWSEREDLWEQWRKIYRNVDNPLRKQQSAEFYLNNKDKMLKGTQVMWPEKESYLDLMLEMEEIGRRAFMKEKQNEPISSDDAIFENISWYHEVGAGLKIESNGVIIPWAELRGTCLGVLDPATGKAKKGRQGDFSCILTGYKHLSTGRVLAHHDWTKRGGPTKFITEIYDLHEKFKYWKFGVETNLYRDSLTLNFNAERDRRQAIEDKKQRDQRRLIKVPFYDIHQTENKIERIMRTEPKVNHGLLLLNRGLSQEFKRQVEDFPHPDNNDDCPDAMEMLWSLANNSFPVSGINADPLGGR